MKDQVKLTSEAQTVKTQKLFNLFTIHFQMGLGYRCNRYSCNNIDIKLKLLNRKTSTKNIKAKTT